MTIGGIIGTVPAYRRSTLSVRIFGIFRGRFRRLQSWVVAVAAGFPTMGRRLGCPGRDRRCRRRTLRLGRGACTGLVRYRWLRFGRTVRRRGAGSSRCRLGLWREFRRQGPRRRPGFSRRRLGWLDRRGFKRFERRGLPEAFPEI